MTTTTPLRHRALRPLDRWRAAVRKPSPEFGPVEITAAAVVRALLRDQPDLADAATPGRITILRLPSAEWVTPIQEAWVTELHRTDDEPPEQPAPEERTLSHEDDDEEPEPFGSPNWFGFARDGSTREFSVTDLRRRVLLALHSGNPVYGWSQDPEGLLPTELLRLADRIVAVPPLSPEVLADALAVLTGEPPRQPIPATLARATGLHDLALAWRPGETADGVLGRLERLLGPAAASPPLMDRLEDLLGMDEARDWGLGLVRELPDYRAGRLRWSDLDHAVLLAGPPGCGKTTFARRLAASLDLPLITGSPQVWQASRDGHLGHALAAMRGTFREARASAPCVLFIDEVDGMGNRANLADSNRDYSTSYLNGLLEELDGTSGLDGVIVVAACNHPSRLDPALIRAGRLNRVLHIDFPDDAALAGILRQRLGADLPEADLLLVARHAHQATGADVEAWVRGARSRARHQGRPMTPDDLLAQVRATEDEMPPQLRRRAAVHEAGHAVVSWLDRPGSVVRVSLSAGPDAGGAVRSLPEDRLMTRAALDRSLRRFLAGRAAEELLLGEPSSGAGGPEHSDLAKATLTATRAVACWGFGSTQPLLWRGEPTASNLHDWLARNPALAKEVDAMLAAAHRSAREMLEANCPALIRVVRALLERGVIEGSDLAPLITPPDVLDDAEPTRSAPR